MDWLAVLLGALLCQVARPATVPEKLDLATLFAYLRSSADPDQWTAMQRFAPFRHTVVDFSVTAVEVRLALQQPRRRAPVV